MENILHADVTKRSFLCTRVVKYDGLMFLGSFHPDIIFVYNIVISVIRRRLYCHFQRTAHIYSEGKIYSMFIE